MFQHPAELVSEEVAVHTTDADAISAHLKVNTALVVMFTNATLGVAAANMGTVNHAIDVDNCAVKMKNTVDHVFEIHYFKLTL